MRDYRVVFDTNVWISMLIGKRLSVLKHLLDSDMVHIIVSDSLLRELKNVMSRPKFTKYFSSEAVADFFSKLYAHSELFATDAATHLCRDPKDDYLLELSLLSNADFLVTGDDDLLVLKKIGNTEIVSVAEFQETLEVM